MTSLFVHPAVELTPAIAQTIGTSSQHPKEITNLSIRNADTHLISTRCALLHTVASASRHGARSPESFFQLADVLFYQELG